MSLFLSGQGLYEGCSSQRAHHVQCLKYFVTNVNLFILSLSRSHLLSHYYSNYLFSPLPLSFSLPSFCSICCPPGCEELASQFSSQEIDGQALLLLKEEHLMSTMNIKLGPALKICAHINNLRD